MPPTARSCRPTLRGDNDPPFENTYADYAVYLDVLAGKDVDAGLAHFRQKLAAAAEEGYAVPGRGDGEPAPRGGRPAEALAVAREHLAAADDRQMSCPGVPDLARRVGDYGAIAEAAKAKDDPVNYLAGLIAAR